MRGGVSVRASRFTEERITFTVKRAEAGTPVLEVCREIGVSEQTYYRTLAINSRNALISLRACRVEEVRIDDQ